jgi:hypothetical protein
MNPWDALVGPGVVQLIQAITIILLIRYPKIMVIFPDTITILTLTLTSVPIAPLFGDVYDWTRFDWYSKGAEN